MDQQGSHTKRHMVMVMVASVEPHHKPVVSHGSSHVVFCLATTHSQVAHTHAHVHTPGTVEDGVVESMVLMRRLTHHTMSTMH